MCCGGSTTTARLAASAAQRYERCDINAVNAAFQRNSASTHGGAVYLDAGTRLHGHVRSALNSAGGNGGAVAEIGTERKFQASGGESLAVNSAGGHGGAVYVGNTDTLWLYAVWDTG
jgi:predicted outer membrane repeat protein